MNVEDPLGKATHKLWREQSHVSGQADQVNLGRSQGRNHFFLMLLALFPLRWDYLSIQSAPSRRPYPRRLRNVGNDDGNLHRQFPILDVVSNGFEIRAASGEQDAESLHARIFCAA